MNDLKKDIIIDNAQKYIFELFKDDSTGHDYWHSIRVYHNATIIAEQENADLFIVKLAALLHDVDDEKFNSKDSNKAITFLKSQELDDETINKILYIIENQSFKKTIGNNNKQETIEAMIVQDADRLDGMGAIGIARTFAYGGSKGRKIYIPNEPVRNYANLDEYINNEGSSINHFYDKLLKLKDMMNTETAKLIAIHRHQFLESFLSEFYNEWNGEYKILR